MFPCIIFSFSPLSLPSSSDSLPFPPSSPCVLLYLPSASPPLSLPISLPPFFIAFLSSRHLTETGSSSKSPKAQSSTIVHTTKLERERERRKTGEPGRGGRHECLVCRGEEQKIQDNKKTNRHKMARDAGGGEG